MTCRLTIITVDSLGHSHNSAAQKLKQYLVSEGNTKWSLSLDTSNIKTEQAKGVPEQVGFNDCGVMALCCTGAFLQDVDGVFEGFLQGKFKDTWLSNASQYWEIIMQHLKGNEGTGVVGNAMEPFRDDVIVKDQKASNEVANNVIG